ncbi:hypothetical protein A6E15_07495 [Natrinema saccharevitans]|uniref:Uncharacterized protein n=1 Tax=Natrinema saccharevitans TaxID=301967 RepID=A0A1S8AW01_9EURY|nr:hypothetical protein [Natrinema saccharevitans]OLZ40842.1 hypothetical protein A6E15_07495 [Natrinema saccharevitans]
MTVANVDRYVDETGVDFKNERAEPIETVYVILKLYEDDFLVHTEMGHLEGFEAGETKRGYPFGTTGGRAGA